MQNSPANKVPSHGTTLFATAHAIDFVPVDERGRTARFGLGSMFGPEPAERFPGFGRLIVAPAAGTVVGIHDGEPDHKAHRGLPSIAYALTQGRRAAAGWAALAGNHVLIDVGDAVVALCHLRRGSIRIGLGERIALGDPLGRCGNSGNSTEPHLHVQAMDAAHPAHARAVPISFGGVMPPNGQIVEPDRP